MQLLLLGATRRCYVVSNTWCGNHMVALSCPPVGTVRAKDYKVLDSKEALW